MTDLDHTIPHALGGPTQAGNLKCLCRIHHVVKTFWGWHDEQLRDGTIIWTGPDGQKYLTHPGSAYLFPALCVPTAAVTITDPGVEPSGADRSVMMPRRRRTRDQQHAADIAAERHNNHQRRTTIRPLDADEYEHQYAIYYGLIDDPDDPPF